MRPFASLLLVAALLSAALAPASAQAQVPAPRTAAQIVLARELDSLRAAPVNAHVVARLRQIDDSLARVEAALERRAAELRARLYGDAPSATHMRPASPLARAASAALVPLGYLAGRRDRDPGGYLDAFQFSLDKQAHAASSALIGALLVPRVGARWAVGACALTGAAFEVGQAHDGGRASVQDATYNAAGCFAGALLARLLR